MDKEESNAEYWQSQASEKRRERTIISDVGAVMRKIGGVEECEKTITVTIRKYVARNAVLLCKGTVNTKRLFVQGDEVEEVCPCNNTSGKAFFIIRKATSKKAKMYCRAFSDVTPSIHFVEDTTKTFTANKRGFTKSDSIECLCIEPIPGCELWVDEALRNVLPSSSELPPPPQDTLLEDSECVHPIIPLRPRGRPRLHDNSNTLPDKTIDLTATNGDILAAVAAAAAVVAGGESAVEGVSGDMSAHQEVPEFAPQAGMTYPGCYPENMMPGTYPPPMGMNLAPVYTRIMDDPINTNEVNGEGTDNRDLREEPDEFIRSVLDDDDCTGYSDNF